MIILAYVDDCILISKEALVIQKFISSLKSGTEDFVFTEEGTMNSYLACVLVVALFVVLGSKFKAWITLSINKGWDKVKPFLSGNEEISMPRYEFIVPSSVNTKSSVPAFKELMNFWMTKASF